MEHELFQSKLKPSVDGALVSGIIRSSSSGLNSHRAAAMELILERSIQDRRKRMLAKAKKNVRPDPTPRPKSGAPDVPTPQVQSSTASQPSSRPLSNDTTGTATSLASAPVKHETSQDSSAHSKPAKKVKVTRREELPADVKKNPSPPDVFVKLACSACGVKQRRNSLWRGLGCGLCSEPWGMDCTGCGTHRARDTDACVRCHRKFK